MVVKVYVSGISGNKEVKKRQQRVLMILDSKNIKYDVIDIAEPGKESDKDFMQQNSKSNGGTVSDPNPRSALPPQIFNDDEYCGDYDQFDMANEIDTLEQFLKVEVPPEELPLAENGPVNGDAAALKKEDTKSSKENSKERDLADGDKGSKEASPSTKQSKEGTPAKEGTPVKESKEGTPAKEGTPVKGSKEGTPAKEGTPVKGSKEGTPAKEGTPVKGSKEGTPAKEGTPVKGSKEGTPAKEGTPVKGSKEGTPAKEGTPVKETTPAKESSPPKEGTPAKESSQEKVTAPKRQKSKSPGKDAKSSKEGTPEVAESVNENGAISSREVSIEKADIIKKDNPSEALIESEQAAAAE